MQITTKDLLYLTDELSWELLAMKKSHHFSRECQDPEVKDLLDKTGQMHQRHYEALLAFLESASNTNPNITQ